MAEDGRGWHRVYSEFCLDGSMLVINIVLGSLDMDMSITEATRAAGGLAEVDRKISKGAEALAEMVSCEIDGVNGDGELAGIRDGAVDGASDLIQRLSKHGGRLEGCLVRLAC